MEMQHVSRLSELLRTILQSNNFVFWKPWLINLYVTCHIGLGKLKQIMLKWLKMWISGLWVVLLLMQFLVVILTLTHTQTKRTYACPSAIKTENRAANVFDFYSANCYQPGRFHISARKAPPRANVFWKWDINASKNCVQPAFLFCFCVCISETLTKCKIQIFQNPSHSLRSNINRNPRISAWSQQPLLQ